jgi:Flp pilus assembly protein TadG
MNDETRGLQDQLSPRRHRRMTHQCTHMLKARLRSLAARLQAEDGTALIEFALVLPVLILIVMGILYFGRYESYANDEQQLASSAARWAAINVNPGSSSSLTLQQYVVQQASPELKGGSGDVSAIKVYVYYPTGSTGQVGQPVRVCVTNSINFVPILGLANSTMVQTATMPVEQSPATNWTADSSIPSQCPSS